jgi:hypothetical protein
MSYTLANAIIGTYPDYAIDPGKVLVSRDGLAPAANASATPTGAGTITFDWEDNSGVGNAKQTDKALIAVINSTKPEAVYDTPVLNVWTSRRILSSLPTGLAKM